MSNADLSQLKIRIKELEQEVQDREADIDVFRKELASANRQLESLIANVSKELKATQALQKILVPTEIPNIPGFDFSSKFIASPYSGGDYYDIFEHVDRSKFGIVMASASGYMMSALLLTVLLKVTGQAEARAGMAPDKLIKLLSKELVGQMDTNDAAEIFYGLFDRRTFTLSYCRVGEIVAFHQDYSSSQLTLLQQSNTGLVSSEKLEVTAHSVELNPRDRILLCSPGVLDVENLEGEKFGKERLMKAILDGEKRGVHEFRNTLMFALQHFSQGVEYKKDITLVVAEVKDRVIRLA